MVRLELPRFLQRLFPIKIFIDQRKIMRRTLLVLCLLIVLPACATPVPVQTEPSRPASAPVLTETIPAPTPTEAMSVMKLPAPSFDSQTYVNEKFGFAIDYPAGWTASEGPLEHSIVARFMSSPNLATLMDWMRELPAGETEVDVEASPRETWNDLEHSIEYARGAWLSSPGFKILGEDELVLEQGFPAVLFTVQVPDPDRTIIFMFTNFKDTALRLSGEGDLELVNEMAQRVRPISVK